MCLGCHKKELFQGKVVHAPVESGKCQVCHNPHDSANVALLKMEPAALCLDCHSEINKGPHVIAGFSRNGHPLGNEKKVAQDPLHPGKKFYCNSCHEPHRSERPKLNRFPLGMESCMTCHKM
jgi:predicted CXXCH cytochrome family protein